jgi:hypothetical protein
MTERRYSLCPACDACPEVVIADGVVTIGEAGNQVRLSPEEWSVLVRRIRSGAVTAAEPAEAGRGSCGCGCDCC